MTYIIGEILVIAATFLIASYTPPNIVRSIGRLTIKCLETTWVYGGYYLRKFVENRLIKPSFSQYKIDDSESEEEEEDSIVTEDPNRNAMRNQNRQTRKVRNSRYNLRPRRIVVTDYQQSGR